jgi:hypothetical protein
MIGFNSKLGKNERKVSYWSLDIIVATPNWLQMCFLIKANRLEVWVRIKVIPRALSRKLEKNNCAYVHLILSESSESRQSLTLSVGFQQGPIGLEGPKGTPVS